MPLRPRRLFARAAHRGTRQRGLALPAIALAFATILPATVAGASGAAPLPRPVFTTVALGSGTTAHRPVAANDIGPTLDVRGFSTDADGRTWVRSDVAGSGSVGLDAETEPTTVRRLTVIGGAGWSLPGGDSGLRWIPVAWTAGATDAAFRLDSMSADGLLASSLSLSIKVDGDAPLATVEPLSVEQGELTLRWSDSDGPGSGIVTRDVRVEEAPATAAGCGTFTPSGGISLGEGDYDQGALSLGPPPSDGCLRVSLALTDLVGHTTLTTSDPYRVVAPAAAVAAGKAKAPSWTGRFNLYRAGTFVTQKKFTWCVAASVQMMVNVVRHHHDRTTTTQARMIEYAQTWDDGPYGEDGGTDLTGWITALHHFGAGKYRAVGTATPGEALRAAATAMRQTGRPAGILVMEGRHAWVLHGFESRTDPRRDARAWIRAVRISGPLYPVQQKNGYDPAPNTRLSVKALERWFQPSSVGALVGKYVVVIPTH
jgi:hypothetical protein